MEKKLGRPRSEKTKEAILSAAYELLLENGFGSVPIPDTGSTINDMIIQVNNLAKFLISREGKVINEIIAEGQFDQKIAEAYRTIYFKPRRLDSRCILERGISRGELKEDLDIELVIDLIFGPLFYRLLITGDMVDETFIKNLIYSVFKGIK